MKVGSHMINIKDKYNRRFFVDIILGPIVMPQLIYFSLKFITTSLEIRNYPNLHYYITLGTMLLLIHSLFRASFIFHQPLREKYWAEKVLPTFKARLTFLLSQKIYLVTLAALAIIYIVLPMNWTSKALIDICQGNKLIALLIFGVATFGISFLSFDSACEYWRIHTEQSAYTDKAYNQLSVTWGVLYTLAPLALMMGLPLLLPLIPDLIDLITLDGLILIGALIVLFILFKLLRSLLKRRECIRDMKKICEEKGYTISFVQKPYLSLFHYSKGENFNITIDQKTYSCKFVSGLQRYVPMALHASGVLHFMYIVRIFKAPLFQISVPKAFGYDSEHAKILIINPTPKFVYQFREGKPFLLDNGDMVGDYKVYTASAFLRALNLDVL